MLPVEQLDGHWRVAVVEDHLFQRRRTEQLIGAQPRVRVVSCHDTLPEFVRSLEGLKGDTWPHVLVLDLHVDRGANVDPRVVRQLIRGGVRVMVLSELTNPSLVREILRSGVGVIVSKRDSEQDVLRAFGAVIARRRWLSRDVALVLHGDSSRPVLSDQEERTLTLYASGHTLDAVADQLGVKRDTAKTYLERVKAKYAAAGRPVRTKVELSRAAIQDGFVEILPVGIDSARESHPRVARIP